MALISFLKFNDIIFMCHLFYCIFVKELEMFPKLSQNQPLNVHPSSGLVNMLLLFRKQSALV